MAALEAALDGAFHDGVDFIPGKAQQLGYGQPLPLHPSCNFFNVRIEATGDLFNWDTLVVKMPRSRLTFAIRTGAASTRAEFGVCPPLRCQLEPFLTFLTLPISSVFTDGLSELNPYCRD